MGTAVRGLRKGRSPRNRRVGPHRGSQLQLRARTGLTAGAGGGRGGQPRSGCRPAFPFRRLLGAHASQRSLCAQPRLAALQGAPSARQKPRWAPGRSAASPSGMEPPEGLRGTFALVWEKAPPTAPLFLSLPPPPDFPTALPRVLLLAPRIPGNSTTKLPLLFNEAAEAGSPSRSEPPSLPPSCHLLFLSFFKGGFLLFLLLFID